ncbi:hypothetical protein MMC14_007708 [Varicellaria rhodocarpa]|nr:hypothetical protein [Varicellaria rhodocarpa]
MRFTGALLMTATALQVAIASPAASLERRVIATTSDSQDSIYSTFHEPCYTNAFSSYCTTFLRPTISNTATVSVTKTVTQTEVVTTETATITANQKVKRAATCTSLYITLPSPSIRSACSCLLTQSPPATTVTASTVTVPVTVTSTVDITAVVTETCAAAAFTAPIANGYFNTGSLASLTASGNGGYGSINSYAGNESFYINLYPETNLLWLNQALTTCPGNLYDLEFAVYFKQGQGSVTPNSQINAFTSDSTTSLYSVQSNIAPNTYISGSGRFLAQTSASVLQFQFLLVTGPYENNLLNNVTVTPVS